MKRFLAIPLVAAAAALIALPARKPAAAAARPLEIYFVDVEGGAATLTVTPAGESVLIDSGWPREDGRDAKRIEQVARYTAGLDHIDHYVNTHWHTDHYGGIEYLTKLMPVRNFWDRGIPPKSTDDAEDFPVLMAAYKRVTGGKSRTLHPGDRIPLRVAGMPLEMINLAQDGKVIGEGKKPFPEFCSKHVTAPVPDVTDNMRSLALLLHYGNFSFLDCGDLTWNMEHKLVCPKNRIGRVDLWQVTHHGWEASNNPAMVDAIQPQVAVMVNGAKKGGSPRTVRTIKKAKSVEAFYQLHRQEENSAEDNTSPDKIMNMNENCKGEYIRVVVNPAADRYTVYKGANTPLQTFRIR